MHSLVSSSAVKMAHTVRETMPIAQEIRTNVNDQGIRRPLEALDAGNRRIVVGMPRRGKNSSLVRHEHRVFPRDRTGKCPSSKPYQQNPLLQSLHDRFCSQQHSL